MTFVQGGRAGNVATILLVCSAGVWAAALCLLAQYPWMSYVLAASEAALIGGLADWFAVTALFRHPMSVPIPHTNIIAARKDRIGSALAAFVSQRFLRRSLLRGRFLKLGLATRAGIWMQDHGNRQGLTLRLLSVLCSEWEESKRREESKGKGAWAHFVGSVPWSGVLGRAIEEAVRSGAHTDWVTRSLPYFRQWLWEHETDVARWIDEAAPWWVPGSARARFLASALDSIDAALVEAQRDPAHPLRARLNHALLSALAELGGRGRDRAAESLPETVWLRTHDELAGWFVQQLERGVREGTGPVYDLVEQGLEELSLAVLRRQRSLDRWCAVYLARVCHQHRDAAAGLIRETVGAWDGAMLSREIEGHVGRDLQFIRINGTVIGAMIGLTLHAFRSILLLFQGI